MVGLPFAEPGYHVVEIESLRLGQALLDKRAPMYVRTGVLVTNLGVHFKLGRENSVVWVTTLDRGKPVEGADVAVNDCRGKPLWTGRSDAKGLAVVAQRLDADMDDCPADAGYFVTARKADDRRQGRRATDLAFVFSSWQKGIEPWRFNVPTGRGAEPDLRAATVFDRTLFRAGETVSMKHFIRTETATGLAAGAGREAADEGQAGAPGQRPGVRLPAAVERRRPQRRHDLEHSAGGQARRLRGLARAARPGRRQAPAAAKAKARATRDRAAGRAATSGSRSSACRWSMRASRGRRRCRSRRRASPSTCR